MNTLKIEKKWQKYWKENHTFEASNKSDKKKYYILVEFPYPSGAGLHVGHVRSYASLDAVARKKRMERLQCVISRAGWHLVYQLRNMQLKSCASKHSR